MNYLFISHTHEISAVVHGYTTLKTNTLYQTDLLKFLRCFESFITCSSTLQYSSWVDCASWQLLIPFWLKVYYIFLRTSHFSFVISFLSHFTPANQGSITTSPRWERIGIEQNDGCSLHGITAWGTTTMVAPVTALRCCQCSHRKMTEDAHSNTVHKTQCHNQKKQHAIRCE